MLYAEMETINVETQRKLMAANYETPCVRRTPKSYNVEVNYVQYGI